MKKILVLLLLATAITGSDLLAERKYFSNAGGIYIDVPWNAKKVDTSDSAAVIIYEKDNIFVAAFFIDDSHFSSWGGMKGILSRKIGCPASNITYHRVGTTSTGFVANYGTYKLQGSIEYYTKNTSGYLFKIVIERYWSPSGEMLDSSSSDLQKCYFSIKPRQGL